MKLFSMIAASLTLASPLAFAGGTTALETKALLLLHVGNQSEIAEGNLAGQRAHDSGIKDFGAMLVADHTDADQKVLALAGERSIDLDAALAASTEVKAEQKDAEAILERLKADTDTAFDADFIKASYDDHVKDVEAITTIRLQLNRDSKVAKFLDDVLPVLKKHRDAAKVLVDRLAGG